MVRDGVFLASAMKLTTPHLALAIFVVSNIALGASLAKTPSSEDAVVFRNCMAMQAKDALENDHCLSVLRKLHVSKDDFVKMKSCESLTSPADDDSNCREMAKKHPELARGHGMVESTNSDQ
jgi:hypothetical protein